MQDHVVLFHPPRKVAGKARFHIGASLRDFTPKVRRRVDETMSKAVDEMSVKELKAMITGAGLQFTDCVEKRDLQARAREAEKKAPAPTKVACEAAPNVMKFAAPSLTKRAIHDLCREGNVQMVTTLLKDSSNLNVADHEGHFNFCTVLSLSHCSSLNLSHLGIFLTALSLRREIVPFHLSVTSCPPQPTAAMQPK